MNPPTFVPNNTAALYSTVGTFLLHKKRRVAQLTSLLDLEMDYRAADAEAKAQQKELWTTYFYEPQFGSSGGKGCRAAMAQSFADFDEKDAEKIEAWSGRPCL